MAILTLSSTLLDFDSVRRQIENHVKTRDAWKGFYATQSGHTIIDAIAAVGTLNSIKLMRYHQDSFPATALSNEAIYNIAAMQGVRISRKVPMEITVRMLSPTGSVLIPKFTQFTVGGFKFFNREAITVASSTVGGSAAHFRLHQGEVTRVEAPGLGEDYQVFYCKESDFMVSDVDVEVRINGETVLREVDGNWKLKGKQGYRDRTTPEGKAVMEFGNEHYASRPNVNDSVEITYVVTEGLRVSIAKTLDKKVRCDMFPSVEGISTTNPSGGADERPIELYKNIAAPSFGTFGAAVTRDQYISTMLAYPGVVDATIFAQRDVNPNASMWMNVMRMVVLTSSPWDDAKRNAFVDHVQNRSMYSVRLVIDHPTPIAVNVIANIYCYPWADRTRCKQEAEIAIRKLFLPRAGIIGYNIFLSDIIKTIKDADKGIEYVKLVQPSSDLYVANTPMNSPAAVVATAAGYLPAGEYHWSVSPVLSVGEIAPRNYTQLIVSENNRSALLMWDTYPNATGYKVWGRKSNRISLLATLPNTHLSWTDDGSVADAPIGSTTLSQTTAALRFNALQNVVINAEPSDRSSSLYLSR